MKRISIVLLLLLCTFSPLTALMSAPGCGFPKSINDTKADQVMSCMACADMDSSSSTSSSMENQCSNCGRKPFSSTMFDHHLFDLDSFPLKLRTPIINNFDNFPTFNIVLIENNSIHTKKDAIIKPPGIQIYDLFCSLLI